MRQSSLFTQTKKEAPSDEQSKNAILLIRAGYVYKEMAGAYVMLPLGLAVVNKISEIIRKEMNSIGGLEIMSTALQNKEVWEKTNRWSDDVVDNWFKTKLKNDSELGLAFTHEEPITNLMKSFVNSYKDLPVYAYDIRTIFRNELRAKSGLMRGREFFWKALYSFSKNKEEHEVFYNKIANAYKNIFQTVGLGDLTFYTFASGGTFSKYSHEFQTVCDAGEDIIYIDRQKNIAINKEVYTDEVINELGLDKNKLEQANAIEVGNIFSLGYKFSEPIGLKYKNQNGEEEFVYMGSYGIGITRLLGVIAEIHSDQDGLCWPESVAPFKIHLTVLGDNENNYKIAEKIYNQIGEENCLFDDRQNLSIGQKLKDADLIGIPTRIVISDKSLEKGGLEISNRKSKESFIVKEDEIISWLQEKHFKN